MNDDKYENEKLAAIRAVKEKIAESDREAGGFGVGFIEGFRAGWAARYDAGDPVGAIQGDNK